jgi:hypothetical protein
MGEFLLALLWFVTGEPLAGLRSSPRRQHGESSGPTGDAIASAHSHRPTCAVDDCGAKRQFILRDGPSLAQAAIDAVQVEHLTL